MLTIQSTSIAPTLMLMVMKPVDELKMNHDEADAMLITTALHFSANTKGNGKLHVWSPDAECSVTRDALHALLPENTLLFWQDTPITHHVHLSVPHNHNLLETTGRTLYIQVD